jgi:hypothetical protein
MNEAATLERPCERAEADTGSAPLPPELGLVPLAFGLELQSMTTLLTVLATVARLGGQVTYLFAAESRATIGLLASRRVAHHVQPTLAQVIGVLAVVEGPC